MCGWKGSTSKPFWILGPNFGPEIRNDQKHQWFKRDWVANKKEHPVETLLLGIFLGRAFCFWQPLVEKPLTSAVKQQGNWRFFLQKKEGFMIFRLSESFTKWSGGSSPRYPFLPLQIRVPGLICRCCKKRIPKSVSGVVFWENFWISISQVSDYKDEIDRLNRELQEVKKKFYDQKKREMIQQDLLFGQEIRFWELYVFPVWVLCWLLRKKIAWGWGCEKPGSMDTKSSNHQLRWEESH